LVAGLSQRRPKFDPKPVHVQFLVDEVALGQVVLSVLRIPSVSMISPMFHTRMAFICHRRKYNLWKWVSLKKPLLSLSLWPNHTASHPRRQ
jgi:hypothetical protein